MGRIPEKLLKKIENNIEKIRSDLRDFPGRTHGDYLENREDAIKIGHIFNWTQSFFTGIALWAYKDTGKKNFLDWTLQFKDEYYKKVYQTPMETMHDLGFLYSLYAVMLYEITGDKTFRELGIGAANALVMRYEPKGRYIRAWGRMDNEVPVYVSPELANDHFFKESEGLAIIDCMMNLPLLFWASEVTGHPFYRRIAIAHADTTLKYFIREDYSVAHAYRFHEETGEALGEANYCGYAIGSHWARGTSWAIYGFSIAYNYTGKPEYLDVAFALLDKFMTECEGNIPLWDFRLPGIAEQSLDTSAAAITLCGIIEMEKNKKNKRLQSYKEMLRTSLERYIDYDEDIMGILKEQDGEHVYASFGDYFLVESYMKEAADIQVW